MNWFREAIQRWKAETPRFFKKIVWVGGSISTIAVAAHTAMTVAGAIEPYWWQTAYPYLVAIPAVMAAVAKLARADSAENK